MRIKLASSSLILHEISGHVEFTLKEKREDLCAGHVPKEDPFNSVFDADPVVLLIALFPYPVRSFLLLSSRVPGSPRWFVPPTDRSMFCPVFGSHYLLETTWDAQ